MGLREKLDASVNTMKAEDNAKTMSRGLKMKVISGNTFGMTRGASKKMSVLSIAGHLVLKKIERAV